MTAPGGGGEHVEVRVTGPEQAVAAVLRLLRTGGPGITGGGARGPYDRNGGRVAYYAHLQVEAPPAPTGPLTLRAPANLPAELLVDRGDVKLCKTSACRRAVVPGLLVCCFPCRSAPDGTHGPHTEVCDRRHIERAGIEAVKAGE